MGTDVTGKEKRGAAPESAEGAELRLDENFELTDETLDALSLGGAGTDEDYQCKHNWVFVRMVPGLIWGENKLYRCTKCGATRKKYD